MPHQLLLAVQYLAVHVAHVKSKYGKSSDISQKIHTHPIYLHSHTPNLPRKKSQTSHTHPHDWKAIAIVLKENKNNNMHNVYDVTDMCTTIKLEASIT